MAFRSSRQGIEPKANPFLGGASRFTEKAYRRLDKSKPFIALGTKMTFILKGLMRQQIDILPRLGSVVSQHGFYLAGGTALSLYLGHRISVDLDWFTQNEMGDALLLAENLRRERLKFVAEQTAPGTLHGKSLTQHAKSPLILLIGPTAVGKTELAIQLAERLDGEIVSSDSRLFYRGMDIGTAKPSPEERARIRHHLIDVADPDETWSLAVFQQKAAEIIADIHARNKLPFLVGGTGQYARAVTEGWTPPEVEPDEKLREELERMKDEMGADWLHAKLDQLDPLAADNIDPRNVRRTIRALEVILTTGRPFSQQRKQSDSPYDLLTIGLKRPREELYRRIDERIEAMFAAGFLDEVQSLLDQGYSPDLPSMSAIGYREGIRVVKGQLSAEQAKVEMRRATRMFVRRQANWFKESDPAIRWFKAGRENVVEEIAEQIRSHLKERAIQKYTPPHDRS
jgi:tRNA dimethylallyltransferase